MRILRRADGSAEEVLAADLVVAATGRDARVPAWLEGSATPGPPRSGSPSASTYASRRLRLPEGALGRDKLVLIGAVPDRPRCLFLFAQEHGRWILSLGGYGPSTARPPTPTATPPSPRRSPRPDVARGDRGGRAARRDP